jgi:D-alanyl-D-alanine carboxypeptidase
MQKLLDDLVADGAAGVLIHYRDGQNEWRGSSGVAELGTDRPIDPDGWFRVGSITKTFTAAVALSLVADGLLELDGTYDEWGPTVTLRQLLNHTTGIYNYTEDLDDVGAIVRERYDHWEPLRAVRMALRHEPLFAPGTDWSYSNTNYTIVGLIIEAVTGNSYADEVRSRVLEPLGLRQTILPGDDIDLPEPHAHGYLSVGDELIDMTKLNASQAWSSGAIISTAGDLNQFYAALLSGKLLPPAQLEAMLTAVPNGEGGRGYGLGIGRRQLADGTILWGHNGGIFGYLTSSFHAVDGSRQFTASYTVAGTESYNPDDLIPAVFESALN